MDEPWPKQWKLIICEDADEYLRSDASAVVCTRDVYGVVMGELVAVLEPPTPIRPSGPSLN